jgi:hypothetical protein
MNVAIAVPEIRHFISNTGINQKLCSMKWIGRKVHGYLDYIVGALLIAVPLIVDGDMNNVAVLVPVLLGAGTILYSFFTDYEMGGIKIIPFKGHLFIDMVNGIFLAASPWLFHFHDTVYLPHVVVGVMEMMVVLLTDPDVKFDKGLTVT